MGGRNVQEEYWKWCLRKYKDVSFQNESREVNTSDINITNKVELWEFCVNLFGKYKFFIEEGRGGKNYGGMISLHWRNKYRTGSGHM